MLYTFFNYNFEIHCVTLNCNKDINKIKNLSRRFLKQFWYGFCRLYEKDSTIFTMCMLSLLLIGTAVAVVERNLRAAYYCHKKNDSRWKNGTKTMIMPGSRLFFISGRNKK